MVVCLQTFPPEQLHVQSESARPTDLSTSHTGLRVALVHDGSDPQSLPKNNGSQDIEGTHAEKHKQGNRVASFSELHPVYRRVGQILCSLVQQPC